MHRVPFVYSSLLTDKLSSIRWTDNRKAKRWYPTSWFWFASPDDLYIECIFIPVGYFIYLFWKMSFQVFCPFFKLIIWLLAIWVKNSLYILDINSWPDITCKYISHSVGCSLHLVVVSLKQAQFSLVWYGPTCLLMLLLLVLWYHI